MSSAKVIVARDGVAWPAKASEITAATTSAAPTSASGPGRSPRMTTAASTDSAGPVPRASG